MNVGAGIFFYCKNTNRHLYLLRADKNPTWSIPGGKLNKDETLLKGLQRECLEEISLWEENWKLIPIQKFVNNSTFVYHTFFCMINEEFIPKLNYEHLGYAWVNIDNYPKPLHSGLFNTINFDVVNEKIKLLIKKGT